MLELVAILGKHRGDSWRIDGTGLVMGRDAECDVVVADPRVSRQHCRIVFDGSAAHFEDLGSRNLALINGSPRQETALAAGDEISLGNHRFLVVNAKARVAVRIADADMPETLSWAHGDSLTLEVEAARPTFEGRPRTVQDLSRLYEVGREFSAVERVDELVRSVRQRLVDRFAPQSLWLAQVPPGGELIFYGEDGRATEPGDAAPVNAIEETLRSRRGFLTPHASGSGDDRVLVFTLVAPMVLGGVGVGALALRTATPHGVYDEEDLLFLVLLAQSLAPIFSAVENIERLRRDNDRLRSRADESLELLGKSQAIQHVRGHIARAAKTDLPVLITGETGTGKELAARLLHAQSPRSERPLVVVNCAAIPPQLFESNVFGHEMGAFTGANSATAGFLAEADGGMLFLDEVGDLSLDNQARILRAIETGTFRRVGAEEDSRVNVHVIAATNKDLATAIATGQFREDLFHRLSGFEIPLPPLRKRPSDVSMLAEHFLELAKQQFSSPVERFAPGTVEALCRRSWPGNVRELRNHVFRAVAAARHNALTPADFGVPGQKTSTGGRDTQLTSLREAEKRYIVRVLEQCHGNVPKAAQVLDVGRSTLYRKMADLGIQASP